jgi:hypothetical protein
MSEEGGRNVSLFFVTNLFKLIKCYIFVEPNIKL